ncbi:hypothetical protein EDB89DRAFT_474161 [Lactarius sanguifluus]|nr:hypothetical protein EDB89DRAFT_474161 [Lactarius sanguifluus]
MIRHHSLMPQTPYCRLSACPWRLEGFSQEITLSVFRSGTSRVSPGVDSLNCGRKGPYDGSHRPASRLAAAKMPRLRPRTLHALWHSCGMQWSRSRKRESPQYCGDWKVANVKRERRKMNSGRISMASSKVVVLCSKVQGRSSPLPQASSPSPEQTTLNETAHTRQMFSVPELQTPLTSFCNDGVCRRRPRHYSPITLIQWTRFVIVGRDCVCDG